MVSHSISELKAAYASRLRKEGQSVSVDVAVGVLPDGEIGQQNTVDILTDHEIIFCTLALDDRSAIALKSKLTFYGRFSPSWKKVVVTQQIIDASAANLLANSDIKLVVMSVSAIAEAQTSTTPLKIKLRGSSLSSRSTASVSQSPETSSKKASAEQVLYRYPDINSVEGGDGINAFVIALTTVILIGMIGVYFTWEEPPADDSAQRSATQHMRASSLMKDQTVS
ncbi:MAG: hypothetical protein AAFY54_02990 [Cyanobacteria bacterium J06648_10]